MKEIHINWPEVSIILPVFYKTVRANGHHATGDELHNVMEAMVGVEYGMQTGIWWELPNMREANL
jgi:hypothetical protein